MTNSGLKCDSLEVSYVITLINSAIYLNHKLIPSPVIDYVVAGIVKHKYTNSGFTGSDTTGLMCQDN